jgi:membrane-associated phospholipid phosphatase
MQENALPFMNNYIRWSVPPFLVLILCMVSYAFADIQAALWFYALKNTIYYQFFNFITIFGESQWYLVPGLLLFVAFYKTKSLLASRALYLFSTVALSGIVADIIKYIAGRARPKLYFNNNLYLFDFFHTEADWTSFPSGHSATAFSAAMVLSIYYPRWKVLFYGCASLIALSRLFITKHYISDVIAGSYLGCASTVLLYNLYFKTVVDEHQAPEI